MPFIIIYVILFIVFLGAPLPLQLIFTVVNMFIPDPIPIVDEVLMAVSITKKIVGGISVLDFVERHPVITLAAFIAAIAGVVIVVF